MRRSAAHVLGAVVAVAAVAVGIAVQAPTSSASAAPAATTNLVTNPGFETGGLAGWSCTPTVSVTTSPVHSGTTAATGTPAGQDNSQCTQAVSVKPSSQYTLTAWVEGSYAYLGDTGTGTTDTSTWTPSATSWTQLTTTFSTGPSTTSTSIWWHGWYGTAAIHVDDVSLTGPAGTTTTTTTPPPTTTTTAPPTTTTTTPPSGGGLPTHALVGYLHESFGNGSGYLPIASVPAAWNVIDLAFADSAGNGNVVFNRCAASECPGVESDAAFQAGIKAAQAAGKKVLVSIGGANGEVQLTSAQDATNFVTSVSAIIDKWGLNGVDIDFENQSLSLNAGDTNFKNPTTPVIVNLISALQQLKARYGTNFVLTMAPETFFVQLGYQFYGPGPNNAQDPRAGAFLPVIYALRNDLTLLTVQDYNSGPIMGLDNQYHTMGGADFHIAMTDMLLTGFAVAGNTANMFPALAPAQVAIGVPANSEAGNGWIPDAQLDQALDCLTKGTSCGSYQIHGTHPDLRGLMTWSINWDHFNNWDFQNNFTSYFG